MEGYRIKRVRDLLGFSQDELATLLGTSNTTIGRYEKGYTVPNEWTVQVLTVFELAATDPRVVGELRAMKERTETPALLWLSSAA